MNEKDKIALELSVLDPNAKRDEHGNVTISMDALVEFCKKPQKIEERDSIKLLRKLNAVAEQAKTDSAMTHLLLIGFHEATGGILVGGDSPMPLEDLWRQLLNQEKNKPTPGKFHQ